MKYILLGSKRETIRSIARRHYIENSDPDIAIQKASDELRAGSIIGAILIGLAIRLIIDLIYYWIKQQIKSPPLVYTTGEPGI